MRLGLCADHIINPEGLLRHTGENLERLDLSDNPMTEEVAPALAEALRKQNKLVRLNLNDASLKDEGIQAIAEVLCPTASVCMNVTCPTWKQPPLWQPVQGLSSFLQDAEGANGKGRTLTLTLWGLGLTGSSWPARSGLMCLLWPTSRSWSEEVRPDHLTAEGMQALATGTRSTATLQYENLLERFSLA